MVKFSGFAGNVGLLKVCRFLARKWDNQLFRRIYCETLNSQTQTLGVFIRVYVFFFFFFFCCYRVIMLFALIVHLICANVHCEICVIVHCEVCACTMWSPCDCMMWSLCDCKIWSLHDLYNVESSCVVVRCSSTCVIVQYEVYAIVQWGVCTIMWNVSYVRRCFSYSARGYVMYNVLVLCLCSVREA